MKRSSLFAGTLTVLLLILLSTDRCWAIPQQAKVFTGPDLLRYFQLVWVPTYPYAARERRVGGRGTYRAFVQANGKVTAVVVIKSAGLPELDDAVIHAAMGWKGKPGKKREVDFPMAFIPPPR